MMSIARSPAGEDRQFSSIDSDLQLPCPPLGTRTTQSGSIDCNGNKHSGRVSEGIRGAAAVVFGARYGALGVIWPFCCIGPVQKSQKYAL